MSEEKVIAEVIGVYPDKIKISVDAIHDFCIPGEKLKVGSYLEVSDDENHRLVAAIESFSIELKEIKDDAGNVDTKRVYIIEAMPLGIVENGKFERGGDTIAIPPTSVRPASFDAIKSIFENSVSDEEKFVFASLAQQENIKVPVDGNKFFNKHIAVVGSTGSGKSHSVARIVQNAISARATGFDGLNNSHIVVFDIHSEYQKAFPDANIITIDGLSLPYWLFNAEELEELFLESGDFNNYNQASVLRNVIVTNKKHHHPEVDKIFFDSPVFFDIDEVASCIKSLASECTMGDDPTKIYVDNQEKCFDSEQEKLCAYFTTDYKFTYKQRTSKKGAYADGTLTKFISRLESKISNDRLEFLFGDAAKNMTFEDVLKQLIGYREGNESNVSIIDLSGVPFEVLSITVSLISRLLHEYGYYYKKICNTVETPLLLVYEEIHKYAPKSDLARYKSSQKAIEAIAKEGRKYGVSLLIATQRPSEVSETIFSQCSNFIAMRLTNPDDQRYVKRLLPDTLGNLTDSLPSLRAGEGILIGEAVVLPSVVKIDKCDPEPSSADVPYLEEWKQAWRDVDFEELTKKWSK
ncbi:anti-phage-associated helicase HerA [Desulfovibrio sp. JC010]|uniref:anti-phage-associated helicase HerA n=1 Tax=Desulfovibrio sp. JC010 TaxID=2593641 RepID=UPI0013D81061|nr:anti-phage-associated helicase HerA [Desulfovibrio sp. JC010]NDV27513.1 ATP-binding protein [Desulfovibrio sp. JC010]